MSEEKFSILIAKVLSEEVSHEELIEFQSLMSEYPERRSQFVNLEEIWRSQPSNKNNLLAVEEAYLLHLGRLKDQVNDFEEDISLLPAHNEDFQLYPVKKSRFRKFFALIVVVLAIFFGAQLVRNLIQQRATLVADNKKHLNEINVNPGVKTKLMLPDGSKVWVNSDSKLSYAETFKGATREVFLEGEAYFDVVKDPSHPFIVHTSGIDVRVLGTAFNVKAYKAEPTIEATLIHGLIEVTKINQPNAPRVILKPHEKIIFYKYAVEESASKDPRPTDDNIIQDENVKPAITIIPLTKNIADSAIVETSWVYNRLSFEDEKFVDLALKMERWYNIRISINNEKVKTYRLTGSFESETIDEALTELQYLVSFKYRVSGNEIIINK